MKAFCLVESDSVLEMMSGEFKTKLFVTFPRKLNRLVEMMLLVSLIFNPQMFRLP